ncbi:unnamed protein product [Clonostachys byssicola]|uniref:Uncharacterized protein n=1 Tax=Clonostachys byssicola TaxID=160290 RepID=A0A9N9TYJ4_9HYPO|nr:unnamed protein product [Clonostachys byssicola]
MDSSLSSVLRPFLSGDLGSEAKLTITELDATTFYNPSLFIVVFAGFLLLVLLAFIVFAFCEKRDRRMKWLKAAEARAKWGV